MIFTSRYGSSICLLLLLLISSGCKPSAQVADSGEMVAEITVQMSIDFNGRAESKSFSVKCEDGATVFWVLQESAQRGLLEMESLGSGETAFVKSIDGVENQRGGGDNWVYRLNGSLGRVGAGAQSVQVGDLIEWQFGRVPDFGDP